jgi:O-antigen/teichoic acid export membrane protein
MTDLSVLPLRARMLRAAGWLLGGNISSQALRLLSNLILTRLLVPEAFGLVAAVNTLYFALVMFSDLGVWQSVVKSDRGTHARFLGTAWAVQLVRGVLLCAVVLLITAGFYWAGAQGFFAQGTVFADPRLAPMIAVFGVCALLQGLESMKLALAQRALQVAYLSRLEVASQLIATAVTLALAWVTSSVWSLLIGTLVASAARTALSHLYLPGNNARPCWDRDCAWEIIGFGKWIFLSSIIGFLAAHGEKLILGATLATASFGIFSIASTLMMAIMGVYGALNAHIIFSALSESFRTSEQATAQVYGRIQQLVDVFLGVMAGGIFMSGHWAVELFYDNRYQDAGWMFQWLGLSLLAVRHQVVEQLMFAKGSPQWVTASNLLRAISLLLLVPAAYAWGGEKAAVAAVVASQFVSWPVALWFKFTQGLLTWTSERVWLPALGLGMLAGWALDSTIWMFMH